MTGGNATLYACCRRLMAVVALTLLAGATLTPQAYSQNSLAEALQQQSEFLPVREAYQLDGALTRDGALRLYWQITDGYYLYQHAFKVRSLNGDTPASLAIDFPPALSKTDEFFGEVQVYYNAADLTVRLPEGAENLSVAVTYQGCADAGLCYPPETETLSIDLSSGSVSASSSAPVDRRPAPAPTAPASDMTLLLALGLAFLGGVILNAMPCVFPILSLKVLSFATGDPSEHRRHGLAYLAGVICSFLLIASVLIALQGAGRWVGWGFQLQSTGFVIALAYGFALMGFSLSGMVLFGAQIHPTAAK